MIDRLLADAGRTSGDQPFLIGADGILSYADAAATAARLAAVLGERGLRRFAIYARDSAALVELVCAAAAADAEICVLNRDYDAQAVARIAARLDIAAVVADGPLGAAGCDVVAMDELFEAAADAAPGDTTSADPRVIILTTGTTGEPKGARYRWASLVAQARRKPGLQGTRWLLAYHLNHFAGFQVLTHVLVNQATLVIPASPSVADALDALVRHRVEYVSATPTFWRTAVANLDRDTARALPLKQITLGGEAVSQDLLALLADYFPAARVSQVFATTEVGSCFSVRDRANGIPAAVLEGGHEGVQVRIVDGQLEIRSPHGMLGYYGSDESADAGGWRSTGDLVEVRGDRIHFVGRSSETINVGGVKVHPLPVEQLVEGVPGVAAVRCYGRRNPVTGQIVVLDVEPAPGADTAELEAAIRTRCAVLEPASQPRLIRFVEALETANRKILRRQS